MNSPDSKTSSNIGGDLAKSLRPQMITLPWLIYSCVIINHVGLELTLIILGLILFVAMYGIVALQNDISDVETDKINKRQDIPYSLGRLNKRQLTYTMLVLSIVATVTGLMLGYETLPWVSLYILLGYLYSGPLNIKSRGAYAALLLGFCYGAMPWLIAASTIGKLNDPYLLSIAVASFIFSSGIIVIKDFKDVIGDKATNKNTLLVTRGPLYTRRYYLIMTSVAYALAIVYPYSVNHSLIFTSVGVAAGITNYLLLASPSILDSSAARSFRGKWSRMIFFTYAIATYFIIAPAA